MTILCIPRDYSVHKSWSPPSPQAMAECEVPCEAERGGAGAVNGEACSPDCDGGVSGTTENNAGEPPYPWCYQLKQDLSQVRNPPQRTVVSSIKV